MQLFEGGGGGAMVGGWLTGQTGRTRGHAAVKAAEQVIGQMNGGFVDRYSVHVCVQYFVCCMVVLQISQM